MSGSQLPPISGVPALSTVERAAVLDALFEPCTALHTLSLDLLHTETFDSYNDLIASVGIQLTDLSESPSTSDTEWLDKILGAHPRLGEKKVESAQSQAEQAQLNTGGEEEATKLGNLNEEYEKTFPGLKYVYEYPPVSLYIPTEIFTACS
jgi:OHCU decarboxylase